MYLSRGDRNGTTWPRRLLLSSRGGRCVRRPSHRAKAPGPEEKEAERRAWATVNKDDKGGKLGGKAAANRPAAARKRRTAR
jgi:hypothetical protein